MLNIAVLEDYADAALRLADWPGEDRITVFRDTSPDPAAPIERLRPFDVICMMRERTPAAIIDALPRLRLIVTRGARNLSIDLAAARARGIVVSEQSLTLFYRQTVEAITAWKEGHPIRQL